MTALNKEPSVISWIGSIQVFLLFFIGTFTGRLTDAGYFRPVIIAGTVMCVLGTFMASLSTQYWQLFLAQGLCCGLGNGFLFCPCVSLLSTYFTTKRSFALAIGAAGSGSGGMVFPAMVEQLLPRIGYPWTMRALGFVQLGCLVLCCIGLKPRVPPRKTGALVDWASFKEPPYLLFAIGMFFVSFLFRSKPPHAYGKIDILGPLLCLLLSWILCTEYYPRPIYAVHQPSHSLKRDWCYWSHTPRFPGRSIFWGF